MEKKEILGSFPSRKTEMFGCGNENGMKTVSFVRAKYDWEKSGILLHTQHAFTVEDISAPGVGVAAPSLFLCLCAHVRQGRMKILNNKRAFNSAKLIHACY